MNASLRTVVRNEEKIKSQRECIAVEFLRTAAEGKRERELIPARGIKVPFLHKVRHG